MAGAEIAERIDPHSPGATVPPSSSVDAATPPSTRAVGTRKRARHGYRFVRAYWTTFVVLAHYLLTFSAARVLGQAWLDRALPDVHASTARRVMRTIVELQGLFIKVGQALSVMANFLPGPFREGLAALQDKVPPRPTDEIRERIERDLGRPLAELYPRFDDTPLASASLGQVHQAWLADGTHVAVKVQHSDIDEIVRLDLRTIRRIMTLVARFVPAKNLDVYYRQIKSMIEEELDFEREARNIERIAANFRDEPTIVFPKPHRALSTKTVMTTDFVNGIKVGELKRIEEAGLDRRALARKIVEAFCQMIFVDGVYHADPHPGNVLVGAKGELVLLDFGAVAELSPQMKEGIPEFVEGVIRRDTERIIKSLKRMGFIARSGSEDVSERIVEFLHERFQEDVKLESFNLKDIKLDPQKGLENLIQLRRMNIGLRDLTEAFEVPRDWVYLERTLLLLTGVCTQLDPEMNPVDVIRPYVESFVLGNRDWAQIALEAVKDAALKAVTIPEDLRKYLVRANRGEAEIRVRGLDRIERSVSRGLRQLVLTALSLGSGYAALQLHLAGDVALSGPLAWISGGLGTLVLVHLVLARD